MTVMERTEKEVLQERDRSGLTRKSGKESVFFLCQQNTETEKNKPIVP